MNHYPLWKNLLVVAVVVLGFIFAMPNLFGESPAVQISRIGSTQFPPSALSQAEAALAKAHISYASAQTEPGRGIILFSSSTTQLKARPVVNKALGDNYSVALNLVPNTPKWVQSMGLKPMAKGLDLVGGIYFRLQVDLKAAVTRMLTNNLRDMQTALRNADVRYSNATRDHNVLKFTFRDGTAADQAKKIIRKSYPQATFTSYSVKDSTVLTVTPSPANIKQTRDLAVSENVAALRRRVNQLGVAEPIVQRLGGNDIVVELPGMQDAARAKQRLGDTATVEFHLVYQGTMSATEAQRTGNVP
ncbi:MAG: protein translocase subunit SecD, partial [Gammaproteobacteria bacterium]